MAVKNNLSAIPNVDSPNHFVPVNEGDFGRVSQKLATQKPQLSTIERLQLQVFGILQSGDLLQKPREVLANDQRPANQLETSMFQITADGLLDSWPRTLSPENQGETKSSCPGISFKGPKRSLGSCPTWYSGLPKAK